MKFRQLGQIDKATYVIEVTDYNSEVKFELQGCLEAERRKKQDHHAVTYEHDPLPFVTSY